MNSKLRKFVIGFISLAVLLAIYLLYSRAGKTPPADTGAGFIDTVADSNVGGLDGERVGMLGDVGVGTMRKAEYITLNEDTKEIEREFGFEELLHKVRDIWEIKKPYMNIYRRNFKCYITADKGSVQFETAVGRSTPKDATFTGNVVIHILPEGSSDIKESHIYLDDLIFQSEKSQLSTAGPIKYVSEDAQMLGTGMEFVYDDELERLEYLKIVDLKSLCIKSSQAAFLPGAKTQPETQQPDEPAVAVDEQEAQPVAAQPEVEQTKAGPERSRRGEYYKCVFSKNVLIDSPEQLVFADEKVCINDIFWAKASETGDEGQATRDDGQGKTQDGEQSPEQDRKQSPERKRGDKPRAAKPDEPNEPPEKFEDTVVTCDAGFVVVPKNSTRTLEEPAHGPTPTNTDVSVRQYPSVFDHAEERTTFIARRVDYNAATGDMDAVGESELKFYTSDAIQTDPNHPADAIQTDPNRPAIPVKVISQKQVRFLQALNRAIFEGGCSCTMVREDPNFQQTYTLLAPKLTIDLLKDTKDGSSTDGIEHLRADGGLVRLASVKTAKEKLLSGVELKCYQVDYDPGQALFVATGPGVINLDNSSVPEPNDQGGRFSLRKPCWASVDNFDTLTYFLDTNRIVADAGSQGLVIDYFPVVDGKYGQQVTVTAGHIVALLTETAEGQTELLSLTASDGIIYKDQDKEFVGSKLFYDAIKSIVTVHGDEFQSCYLDGNPVDAIEWDLKTDRIKADIVGPGALQLR